MTLRFKIDEILSMSRDEEVLREKAPKLLIQSFMDSLPKHSDIVNSDFIQGEEAMLYEIEENLKQEML